MYHVESPIGTVVASFRDEGLLQEWLHENIQSGQGYIVRRWAVAVTLHSAGNAPPPGVLVPMGGRGLQQPAMVPPPAVTTVVTFSITHNPNQPPVG